MHATDYADFDVDLDGTLLSPFAAQFALLTGPGLSPSASRPLP